MIVPALVALIAHHYHGQQQATAVGALGSARAAAGVCAFLIGGMLGTFIGWRPVFGILIVVCALVLFLSTKLKPEAPRPEVKIDLVGVVLAAANYPDTPQKGDVIGGLPKANSFGDDCHVFHAGTANQDSKVVTNGGRVLCVTALGENVKLAQKRAYEAVAQIGWDGMQFRKDIGHRAINR